MYSCGVTGSPALARPEEFALLPTWEELRRLSIDPMIAHPVIEDLVALRDVDRPIVPAALRLLARVMRNSTWSELARAGHAEILDALTEQVARSLRIGNDSSESMTLSGAAAGVRRPYCQLPCSRATLARRVALAQQHCRPDGKILVVGDDDLLSLALARAGFRDIQVVDIDPKVIAEIAARAAEENLGITARVHDLRASPPKDLVSEYDLVCLDPMCTLEGLRIFLGAAARFSAPSHPMTLLLCTHLMSLMPAGQPALRALLAELHLDVVSFHPALNVYPLSRSFHRFHRTILRVANALVYRSEAMRREDCAIRHFVSDAIVLRRAAV